MQVGLLSRQVISHGFMLWRGLEKFADALQDDVADLLEMPNEAWHGTVAFLA